MVTPAVRRNFSTLVAAAYVDGTVSAPERQVLHRKATEMNIPLPVMNEILALGERGKLSAALPGAASERQALLDDLIDIVCADGRVEAPEHHLIAKFAGHLGIALPDLRARVRERMNRKPEPSKTVFEPRIEEVRVAPTEPPKPLPASAEPEPPPLPDIPPVTLQLIKQAVMFETPADAVRYVERMLGVMRPEAEQIIRRVLAAFPELKPGSLSVKRR